MILNGTERNAQTLADLFVGKTLYITERELFAAARLKLADGLGDDIPQVGIEYAGNNRVAVR